MSNIPKNAEEYRAWFAEQYPDIPYGTCCCGCGRATHIATKTQRDRHWFKGEPYRYVVGHVDKQKLTGRPPKATRYKIDPESGCWIWLLTSYEGYGSCWHRGRLRGAHVAMYECYYGPVPDGHELHHLCVEAGFGDTLCVRPSHLTPISHTDNVRRGRRAKLTPGIAREIRELYADGYWTQTAIGQKFGVSQGTVGKVVRNEHWRNV